MPDNQLLKYFNKKGAVASGPFTPQAVYDPDGDCIEFLASDESYYAERVDNLVTVYYGQRSGRIVGSLIKGVSKFIRQVLAWSPGFKIDIKDGKVRLEHLFTAQIWHAKFPPRGTRIVTYEKLRKVAKEQEVEAEIGDLQTA